MQRRQARLSLSRRHLAVSHRALVVPHGNIPLNPGRRARMVLAKWNSSISSLGLSTTMSPPSPTAGALGVTFLGTASCPYDEV